jgi:hypothetical protein
MDWLWVNVLPWSSGYNFRNELHIANARGEQVLKRNMLAAATL